MDSVLTRKMPCSCGCAAQLAALQLEVAALRAEWRNSPYFGGESGEKNGKVAKSATSTPWPPAETDQKTSKTKKKERTSTVFKRRIVASTLRRLVEQARPPKRARKRVSADEVWKAMAPADQAAVGAKRTCERLVADMDTRRAFNMTPNTGLEDWDAYCRSQSKQGW